MRELSATAVQSAVAAMVIDANCRISPQVLQQMERCRAEEEQPLAASILGRIIENDRLAAERCVPMCQDTGMAVFRVQLGQELHITGGSLEAAIQEGVRQGYREGYLRKSVVADPVFHRDNTGDNTPAVIYYELTAGDGLTLTFEQYVLVGSTVKSYLAWLKDTGRLTVLFEDNRLLWRRV